MKVDWKRRYNDLKREHDKTMKKLAYEFSYLRYAAYDISRLDFGSAKTRCELHLPTIEQILGSEYVDFFRDEDAAR